MIDIERIYKYVNLLEGKRFITASECHDIDRNFTRHFLT